MHFHLPKPLHGWRELAGEVGIIVVGVLIALMFEAVVDGITWQRKVAAARTELRYELGHDLAILSLSPWRLSAYGGPLLPSKEPHS